MKRKKVYPMSLREAGSIYRKMSYIRHQTQFNTYRKGYAYLLQLVAENERIINSLSLNNRALAKAVAKERENCGIHLRDKISTEKLYFDLINEHSIVKANLLNLEREIISIDEALTTSMIPNLVRLSDDITNIKLKNGSLRETFSSLNPDKTPKKIWNRPPQIVSAAQYSQYSPIYEETENDIMEIGTRKCKGGFRNIFNLCNRKDSSKRDTPNSKANCYNFTEKNENSFNSNDSDTSSSHDCSVNSSETKRQVNFSHSDFLSDQEAEKENQMNVYNAANDQEYEDEMVSSLLSPKVVLRRVSRKTIEIIDGSLSRNSGIEYHNQSESKPATRRSSRRIASREEKLEPTSSRSARLLSTDEDSSKRASLHSKVEHNHQTSENFNVSEPNLLRLNSSVEDEANNNKFLMVTERKKSSRRMSNSDRESKPKKSKRFFTNTKTNETMISSKTTELENKNEMMEFENTSQRNNIFANDSVIEISFGEGRSLRSRSKISYKEKPLNLKLRKH